MALFLLGLAGCAQAFASTSVNGDAGPAKDTAEAPRRESVASDAGSEGGRAEAPPYTGPRSPPLRGAKLHSPMPGGFLGGWNGDTGLDIAGNRRDVFAIAAGTLDYSEWGHTLWTRGRDTPYSVRLALDEPIPWGEHRITHVYYTHLSKVETQQAEGSASPKHVEAGERIGVSGIGNGVPHLHLGLLLDGQVEQDSWTFILREGDIRKVMGNYRNGELLPLKSNRPSPVL
jgi:murein DD-endopeptidase MepM/ murein hydrolase activator NlpD